MAKTKVFGIEIPKRILGFKLSKGSRKDVRRLLKGLETPEARALAVSAVGVLVAFVAERAAERDGLVGKGRAKSRPPRSPTRSAPAL